MIWRTAFRMNLRYYRRHRLLALLCALGIALGVGIVVAVKLINASALESFSSSVDYLSRGATHSVVSTFGGIPEDRFRAIWTDGAVKAASPVVEAMATTRETSEEPVRFIGVDPLLDRDFRSLVKAADRSREFVRFAVAHVPGVYLSPGLMNRHGLKKGDVLHVSVAGSEHRLEILGPLANAGPGGAADNLAVLDIAAAQEIFSRVGYLDRVDLIVEGDAAALARRLPQGLEITDRSERKAALQAMLSSFELNLAAMSLLALFTGVFLIYNFSMFSVLSRREDISLLLTLGCDRRSLVLAFLAESLLLALFGSMAGLLLGHLLATLGLGKVSASISDLYFFLKIEQVRLSAPVVLVGLGVGFAATLAGTFLPALEVAVTRPVVGMKRRSIEDRAHGFKGMLLLLGALCIVCSIAAAAASRFSVTWGFVSAFGVTLGFALFTPAYLSLFARHAGTALRRVTGSLTGFLAARTMGASLSRTSAAVAALAVALSMTLGVDGMIHSFRMSVVQWLDGTLQGDLYIAPDTTKWGHVLPPVLIDFVRRLPQVDAVERFSTYVVTVRGKRVKLRVVSGRVLKDHARYHFIAGGREAWNRFLRGGVFVSESLRFRTGIDLGDEVVLDTPSGRRGFPVVAVTRDYSTDMGAIHMDRSVYERIWKDNRIQSVALFLKPGGSREEVRKVIQKRFPGPASRMVSNARMKRNILVIFDRTFAPTATLKGVSLLVALLGVATALTTILLERSRELTVLRYMGMTRRELATMNLQQALMMGLAAYLSAVVCGAALTYVIVDAINFRSFGWSMDVSFSPLILAKTLGLTLGACLVASLYPAFRLMRAPSAPSYEEE